MDWRNKPLVRPLLFLIIGILLGSYFPNFNPIDLCLIGLVFLSLLLLLQSNLISYSARKYFGWIFHLSFAILGYTLVSTLNPIHNPNHILHFKEKNILASGIVSSAPTSGKKIQIQLKLSTRHKNNESQKVTGSILAYLPITQESQDLVLGDEILFKAIINPTSTSSNPYSFDFRSFYSKKDIYHQANILEWKVVKESHPLLSEISKQRKKLIQILSAHLPTENEFAVGAALCLGSKEFLTDEIKNEYAGTGAMHVLAISGLHVGIVFSFLFVLFSTFKTRKTFWLIIKITVTITILWLYALFTGASPSVLRAALMFSFITVSLYLRRHVDTYNTLSAAAISLLVYNPNLLFDVGFQLSFTAVAGIVYFQPRIYELLSFENRIFDYLWQISTVGIAAQIATFPIGLYYFHHLPFLFLLTGFFVVPFAYLILLFSILLFITSYFSNVIAFWVGKILYLIIWTNNALIHFISELEDGLEFYFFIGVLSLLALYACLYLFDLYFKTGSPKAIICALCLILSFTLYNVVYKTSNQKQGFICVYELRKSSLIDIGYKSERKSFNDNQNEGKSLQFASENLRKFHGLFNPVNSKKAIREFQQLTFAGDKRVAIIKDNSFPSSKLKVDYLILSNDNIEIKKAISSFTFEHLIFDGNITTDQLSNWKRHCDENNIQFHNVKTDGAFYELI